MAQSEFAATYGQTTNPFKDTPNTARPARPGTSPTAPVGATGVSGYPPDPGLTAWRTGGYAPPKAPASSFASQAMAGWDQTKWSDPNHQSPKYVVGRILSNYNVADPAQRAAAAPGRQPTA